MSERDDRDGVVGRLEPRHTFFLNPYSDFRFTRCPECSRPMKVRKKPFFIHVEPMEPVMLNMSARYCPPCDLLILHQGMVEKLLVSTFEEHQPEIIGNDYLVVGTVERSYWRRHESQGTVGAAGEHLHDFQHVVDYELEHHGWVEENEGEEPSSH